MSGICGIFNLDGAPVADEELSIVTAMLERRGPERTGTWRDGCIGLGHTLLATTPESLFERQPFEHTDTGCVITADVRLDNREELIESLGIVKKAESVGDSELVLAAYLNFGEDCLARLLGDFAFAIWDPRHQRLFAARDHFGLRPLYFHHAPGRCFVFGSGARPILALPKVPYSLNEGRIADFLVPELEWIDYTSTFFEHVYRLPPGHAAVIDRHKLSISEYWMPAPGPNPGPLSDEELAEGFLEVLTTAVAARLRAPPGTVGATMSGGIDSCTIVAIAKDILAGQCKEHLCTYSAVNSVDQGCVETRAIRAATRISAISPALVDLGEVGDLYGSLSSGYDEPFDGDFSFLKAIYLRAGAASQKRILDGGASDAVLSEGSYIPRLIRDGHWRAALMEISGERDFWGGAMGISRVFRYLRAAVIPDAVKARYRKLRPVPGIGRYLKDSLIAPDFADRVSIRDRFACLQRMVAPAYGIDYPVERCDAIRPNVTAGRERYARIAATVGLEASSPFLDRRVVEYAAWLPGRLRIRNGWPKMVLRDLMSDRLPREIVRSRGKPHLGWRFNEAVTRKAIDQGEIEIARLQGELKDYVKPEALTEAWNSFADGSNIQPLQTARVLYIWLAENANRPVVER
jgi:asparagine synthase (glutamine-hydrolysing)